MIRHFEKSIEEAPSVLKDKIKVCAVMLEVTHAFCDTG